MELIKKDDDAVQIVTRRDQTKAQLLRSKKVAEDRIKRLQDTLKDIQSMLDLLE